VKPTLKSRFFYLKMEKIKVVLSYQQVIFREGIHFILSGEEDFEVAGETTGNKEALELIESSQANVVILSQADEKSDSAEITRRIKQSYPSVSVILITQKDESERIFPDIVAGISASLTADTEPERMVSVIREVAQGQLPIIEALLAPALAARALAVFQDLATLNERLGISMAQLTKKESEVLSGIASGIDQGQVAAGLKVPEAAVRDHLRAVLQKLVANDRTRELIEKTQMSLPSLLHLMPGGGGRPAEYLTRAEFNEFKDSLMNAIKSAFTEKPRS
jgi:DNA-binding NarL/FixJ family response regulator